MAKPFSPLKTEKGEFCKLEDEFQTKLFEIKEIKFTCGPDMSIDIKAVL